jgi:hypothetical protein
MVLILKPKLRELHLLYEHSKLEYIREKPQSQINSKFNQLKNQMEFNQTLPQMIILSFTTKIPTMNYSKDLPLELITSLRRY